MPIPVVINGVEAFALTLDEWCEPLGENHPAKVELKKLRDALAAQAQTITKLEEELASRKVRVIYKKYRKPNRNETAAKPSPAKAPAAANPNPDRTVPPAGSQPVQ